MQIDETVSQDLHKQFTVTVPASELDSRVNARLEEMKPRVNLKGFRPGKAPVSFQEAVRQVDHGRSGGSRRQ